MKQTRKGPGRAAFLWRVLVNTSAAIFLLQIALATPMFDGIVESWLHTGYVDPAKPPRYIVILGGGGIPSDTGLMRTYYGAEQSKSYPGATVIVALPADDDPDTASVGRMRDELLMRGVPEHSIRMVAEGRNTHEQAERIRAVLGAEQLEQPLHLVTERSHLRRSILCFRKAGFSQVYGIGTHNTGAEADVGAWTFLRYTLWSNLQLEIRVLREVLATGIYWLRGWV